MSYQEPENPLDHTDDVNAEQLAQPGTGFWNRGQIKYILLLIAGVLAMTLTGILIQEPANPEEYIASAGYAGVFLMGIIGSSAPIWPLPGSWAAFIAAGLGLNPLVVGLAAGLGEPIGELSGYTAGYGGQIVVQKWKRYTQIEYWMRRHGGLTIFVVSAIPNFLIKLATIAAGTLRYPFRRFFVFCWAGKTVKSLGFAFAGAGLFDGIRHLLESTFSTF